MHSRIPCRSRLALHDLVCGVGRDIPRPDTSRTLPTMLRDICWTKAATTVAFAAL
jgi:hypothetical protein